MNVTALLDTPVRSSAPLDPAVGDDAADPAFANVMSQYQGNGNKSLTNEPPKGELDTKQDAAVDAATNANVDENPVESPATTDEVPVSLADLLGAEGTTLPPDGQALPIADGSPQPDDAAKGLDATDASIAASMIATAPVAPAPAPATGITVPIPAPVATPDATANVAAMPRAPEAVVSAAQQALDPAAADIDAPVQLPAIDPRTVKKDGDAAAIAPVAVAPPADDSAQPASLTHALRALALGHRQAAPDGNTTPPPATGQQRGPNNPSGDPSRGDGIAKIANAHLAATLEAANGPKDTPVLQKDGFADSIRTDAVLPRANAANGAIEVRDTAATRLGDLAQQHAPRFAAELADRVLVLRSQRFDSATVSLEPRELGRIDIQVRLQADTTHVAFSAQHAGVRDALEGQMPRLRAMLEEAGLSLGNVDVAHSGSRGAGDSGTARSYSGTQSVTAADADVADASPRWQRRTELSIIDLHA